MFLVFSNSYVSTKMRGVLRDRWKQTTLLGNCQTANIMVFLHFLFSKIVLSLPVFGIVHFSLQSPENDNSSMSYTYLLSLIRNTACPSYNMVPKPIVSVTQWNLLEIWIPGWYWREYIGSQGLFLAQGINIAGNAWEDTCSS